MTEQFWQTLHARLAQRQWRKAWNSLIDLALALRGTHLRETLCSLEAWDALPLAQANQADKHEAARQQLLTTLAQSLQLAHHKPPPHEAGATAHPFIRATDLSKVYGAGFALGPINLSVQTGEIAGLVGENGNGKTTLLRLLAGDLQKTAGTLDYGIEQRDIYALRTQLVYIAQRPRKWAGSLMDQLQFVASCYGVPVRDNRVITELVVARLGLRSYQHLSWSALSSGYKMRFELARALLQNPRILLLDEPLANLDINAQQSLLMDLKELVELPWQPMVLVMSSQQLYEVEKISSQVVFLEQGKPRNLQHSFANMKGCAVEFETALDAATLELALQDLPAHHLVQNGQTWIITFSEALQTQQLLEHFVAKAVPLHYFRDITQSTRRLFVQE